MKESSLTINIIITCTENIVKSKSLHLAIASQLAATCMIFNPPGNELNDRI